MAQDKANDVATGQQSDLPITAAGRPVTAQQTDLTSNAAGQTQRIDVTVKGGHYIVNGVHVDANGEAIKEDTK